MDTQPKPRRGVRLVCAALVLLLALTVLAACGGPKKEDLLAAMGVAESDYNYVKMSESESGVIILGKEVAETSKLITRMELGKMLAKETDDSSMSALYERWSEIRDEAREESKALQEKLTANYKGDAVVELTVCTAKGAVAMRLRNGEVTYDYVTSAH